MAEMYAHYTRYGIAEPVPVRYTAKTFWQGRCRCGWEGQEFEHEETADADCAEHMRLVADEK